MSIYYKSFIYKDNELYSGIGTGKVLPFKRDILYTFNDIHSNVEGYCCHANQELNTHYIVLGHMAIYHTLLQHDNPMDTLVGPYSYNALIKKAIDRCMSNAYPSSSWMEGVYAQCIVKGTLSRTLGHQCELSTMKIIGEPIIIDGLSTIKEIIKKYPVSISTGESLTSDIINTI